MIENAISDKEFHDFQQMLHRIAGIYLPDTKKALLCGRLAKRLRTRNLSSYGDYFKLLMSGREADELQTAVDLLTTNETYFFREPKHFDYLKQHILPQARHGRQFRVWSAASSSGEEPYSIAMTLASHFDDHGWEVLGSDLSTRVLEKAKAGLYPMERAEHIPHAMLTRYCLKGVGEQAGNFMIEPKLKNHVRFMQINLNAPLPETGEFDVIFLRNVMIYFELEMKRQVVARLLPRLRSGGWFIIGHSESLNGVTEVLHPEAPTIYRKP